MNGLMKKMKGWKVLVIEYLGRFSWRAYLLLTTWPGLEETCHAHHVIYLWDKIAWSRTLPLLGSRGMRSRLPMMKDKLTIKPGMSISAQECIHTTPTHCISRWSRGWWRHSHAIPIFCDFSARTMPTSPWLVGSLDSKFMYTSWLEKDLIKDGELIDEICRVHKRFKRKWDRGWNSCWNSFAERQWQNLTD